MPKVERVVHPRGYRKQVLARASDPAKAAQQHPLGDVNINSIMRKYHKTGFLPRYEKAAAVYGDFTEVGDFQAAMNTVIRGRELFETIPADIRAKFDNDPHQFLEFMRQAEPDDVREIGLGGLLVVREQAAAPTPEPVSPAPEPAPEPPQPPSDQ